MKARKKPVEIEAVQWTGENFKEVTDFIGDSRKWYIESGTDVPCSLVIETLEGDHQAKIGDYIIRGVKGEVYPCKPDIFEMTYEVEPFVDAAPVVHAHWKRTNGGKWRCSNCRGRQEKPSRYCKECGARMDERRKENDG